MLQLRGAGICNIRGWFYRLCSNRTSWTCRNSRAGISLPRMCLIMQMPLKFPRNICRARRKPAAGVHAPIHLSSLHLKKRICILIRLKVRPKISPTSPDWISQFHYAQGNVRAAAKFLGKKLIIVTWAQFHPQIRGHRPLPPLCVPLGVVAKTFDAKIYICVCALAHQTLVLDEMKFSLWEKRARSFLWEMKSAPSCESSSGALIMKKGSKLSRLWRPRAA